jgi:hypothetical protein
LTFSYINTYYRLREFLGKGEGKAAWVHTLKWILFGLSAFLVLMIIILEINL